MKHAFLIIAHDNWWQLKNLIQLLDYKNHDIYVHIDKKSKDFNVNFFNNITDYSNVYFFQEYDVYWGGFSIVQVELLLFRKANEKNYDYYHLLSGMDLPLVDNKTFDNFFEREEKKEYIHFDEKALSTNPEINRRTRYYHFLQNYRRRYKKKWKNEIFTFFERILLVLQIVFRVNRVKNNDWKIKYGSQWFSITDELVRTILLNCEKIENTFKYTNCADELFIQTIAYNCGFLDKIYTSSTGDFSNLRYIDWQRGSKGNPYTFRCTDIISLDEQFNKYLFARKFNEKIDKKVIEYVTSVISDKISKKILK